MSHQHHPSEQTAIPTGSPVPVVPLVHTVPPVPPCFRRHASTLRTIAVNHNLSSIEDLDTTNILVTPYVQVFDAITVTIHPSSYTGVIPFVAILPVLSCRRQTAQTFNDTDEQQLDEIPNVTETNTINVADTHTTDVTKSNTANVRIDSILPNPIEDNANAVSHRWVHADLSDEEDYYSDEDLDYYPDLRSPGVSDNDFDDNNNQHSFDLSTWLRISSALQDDNMPPDNDSVNNFQDDNTSLNGGDDQVDNFQVDITPLDNDGNFVTGGSTSFNAVDYDNNYDTNGGWDSFIEQNPNLIPNEESSGENDELPEEFNQKLFHLSHGYPGTCSIKDSSFGPKREYR